MEEQQSFEAWEKQASAALRRSPLWGSVVYRKAMYLYDLAWQDCDVLKTDFRGKTVASQLIRSVGSIAANLEESFGRGVQTPDFRRILRIALGEAREARGWYLRSRHMLAGEVVEQRVALLDEIIRLLLASIRQP